MTAKLLDGKALADQLQSEIAARAAKFKFATGITPCLAAVLAGDDPASEVYVRNKQQSCERAGMTSQLHRLPANATSKQLLDLVAQLSADSKIHGILIQLPLPKQIDPMASLAALSPLKDVDALHPENVGLLAQGRPRFFPCTPHGIQKLLLHNQIEIAGKHVVIVGRSEIVGKPLALMLMQRRPDANATVTVCHSRTRNLPEITRQAEILIVAIGQPKFITADMVRPGNVVVDVGMNRESGKLCGDVDFEGVRQVAGAITPVPGGVGPLTITMLLENTLAAANLQHPFKT